ncbi:MAG: DUF1428 domain-containing protein [Candidatus Peribacteraceae bacterium]
MSYVDGFVLTIKNDKINAYKEMATIGGRLWKKHGALSYMECRGDDLHSEHCKLPFPTLTKCSADETVFFSFIVYKDKAHRDQVNAAVMADPEMNAYDPNNMPLDMEKMSFGGFEAIVEC